MQTNSVSIAIPSLPTAPLYRSINSTRSYGTLHQALDTECEHAVQCSYRCGFLNFENCASPLLPTKATSTAFVASWYFSEYVDSVHRSHHSPHTNEGYALQVRVSNISVFGRVSIFRFFPFHAPAMPLRKYVCVLCVRACDN